MAARTPIMKLLCAVIQRRGLAYEAFSAATVHKDFPSVINVGRIDGDVTKPRPYGIDIDAGSKQVGRS
jgi:hypothetical protein